MTEPMNIRLVIAAPQGVAAKLKGILAAAQIEPDAVCCSGGEALTALAGGDALLLTTWRLPDMSGAELVGQAGQGAGTLMIVPQDYTPSGGENAMLLRNPISQDALVAAVRAMRFCGARLQALRLRAEKLERTLEERKIIERAKGRLMDALHLSESEAHYRMQKISMDTGRRIVDVAREILEAQEIAS